MLLLPRILFNRCEDSNGHSGWLQCLHHLRAKLSCGSLQGLILGLGGTDLASEVAVSLEHSAQEFKLKWQLDCTMLGIVCALLTHVMSDRAPTCLVARESAHTRHPARPINDKLNVV